MIDFDSVLDEYDTVYKFTIKAADMKSPDKMISLSKEISVTKCYDDKGYLHRYVLQPFLDEAIKRFEEFHSTDKKGK